MKILVVSSFLPYPLFSGGHVRLYNLLKQLSLHHEITLVCEKRSHQTMTDVQEVKKICKDVIVIDRKKQWSPEVIFQTAISAKPFLLVGHELPEMRNKITELLAQQMFDVIHVETFYVAQNVPNTTVPTVLVEHNIEYKVYERFAKTTPFFVKPLLKIDVEKIKYWEEKSWSDATKVVGVSKIEAAQMRKDAVVVPNGVSLTDFPLKKDTPAKEKTILFMGDFKWIQNVSAVEWILKDIWPEIIKKQNSVKLWIVGKHIPDHLKQYTSAHIIFDEHAPDKTSEIYRRSDILLAPIRVGGGTSYKILEAMASGVPVVTTKLGIEGLQAKKDHEALVGSTGIELAHDVLKLLEDKRLYKMIEENARKFIESTYTWEKIAKILEGVYQDAIKK